MRAVSDNGKKIGRFVGICGGGIEKFVDDTLEFGFHWLVLDVNLDVLLLRKVVE